MKSIFYGLGNSKYLILRASTFAETSLKATEEVVRVSNIVEPVGDDTFQKLHDAGSRLIGRKEATSLGDFPAFTMGL